MKLYTRIDNYKKYKYCRFCFNQLSKPVINLGLMPLAGGFLKSEKIKEKYYPLELSFCQNCLLLQSINVINKNKLFKNYFYFSSKIKTLVNYFNQVAHEIKKGFKNPKNVSILEIGSNDGALLSKLSNLGFKVLGVEPAVNIVKNISNKNTKTINAYFTYPLAKKISKKYKKFDAIVSFNALAHIENMHSVMKGIKCLLKKDGILEFGVHYLGKLIEDRQFDMIYHEHQYYYSVIALKKFLTLYDMEIYDVKQTNVHGGSIIVFAQNKNYGTKKITKNVEKIIKKEFGMDLDQISTYTSFMETVKDSKLNLLKLLKKLIAQHQTIAGYGASGRGTIMTNYCKLKKNLINYVIDDAPAKKGLYTPGNHLKIFPSSILYGRHKPDYILLFAWAFNDEIKKRHRKFIKNGGKFIIPLPKVTISS